LQDGPLLSGPLEINPQLVQESRDKAAQAGVADRVQFMYSGLFTNDVSSASVVVLYLGHRANLGRLL
jgi:hypothetical protein